MPWTEFTSGYYTAIRGMDHRADWLLGPGIRDFLPDGDATLIPFIMNPMDEAALSAIQAFITHGMGDDRPGPPFYIPSHYLKDKLRVDRSFTAFAPKAFFDDLRAEGGTYEQLRNAAKEIKLCTPIAGAAPKWQPGQKIVPLEGPTLGPPEGGWPDDTVIIGVIDDGIAFAHEHFRRADGTTRVECFWRQDGPQGSTVDTGSEICKHDSNTGAPGIDSLLGQSRVAGSVDEDLLYRRAGLIDFAEPGHKAAAWRAAHGTHVLDIAAGADPKRCDVANRPIIAVQLPAATTADTSGKTELDDKVLEGIDYILRRADALSGDGPRLPVVINFSYGTIAERHDGTAYLEGAIDDFIVDQAGRLRVFLPAGNSHLSRCHVAVNFPDACSAMLELRVQPDDLTQSWLEIWMPHDGAGAPSSHRMKISLQTPAGASSAEVGETHNAGVHFTNDNGDVVCQAGYFFKDGRTERGVFSIQLQPTARLGPTTPPELADKVVAPGPWKIQLQNIRLAPERTVHAWIQRDDSVYGYPRRGRQAYFDHDCYVRFDAQGREIEDDSHAEQGECLVTRASLINALATGAESIVAGGFLRKDFRIARYSAGGPITPTRDVPSDPELTKPDACMVSDDSKVHAGVLAAGSRSGSTVAFSGTSVAAPQLARLIAGEMGVGKASDRAAVRAIAEASDPGAPPLPANRGGWGRLAGPARVALPRYWD